MSSAACACGKPADLRPVLFSEPVCPECIIRRDIKTHEDFLVLCREDLFQSLNSPTPVAGEQELILQHMADTERTIYTLRGELT